jgi:predicted transcriptional regulator
MPNTVSDVMTRRPKAVRRSATLAEAALTMLDQRVQELPVVDDDERLLGMVTAHDLFSISGDTVENGIRPPRLVFSHEVSSIEAARMMRKTGSQRAVVVEGDRLVGVLTFEDALVDYGDG